MRKLIIDSSVDFSPEVKKILDEYYRVPFKIIIDEEEIIDLNIDTTQLLYKLKSSKSHIKSACPSPNDFINNFDAKKENFVLTISSSLSGSYNSAILAKNIFIDNNPDANIYVFDSKTAGAGTTLLAIKLKEMMDSDLPADKICIEMEKLISNINTLFILKSLDNLIKNGRINAIKAKIVSLLHIIPILSGDKDGAISIADKARGEKRAFSRMLELIEETKLDFTSMDIGITHCNNHSKAQVLKAIFENDYKFKRVFIFESGGLSTIYEDDGGIIISF